MPLERIAGPVEGDVLGKLDRQILLRHWHHAASLAMNHWDRTTPIALARDAPIAQAEVNLPLGDRLQPLIPAKAGIQGPLTRRPGFWVPAGAGTSGAGAHFAFQTLCHLLLRLRGRHAIEEA